jgi:hypothetical protein
MASFVSDPSQNGLSAKAFTRVDSKMSNHVTCVQGFQIYVIGEEEFSLKEAETA